MEISDIKRWHWILIGLVVGFGLGWVWSGAETDNSGRLINQFDFEREVRRTHPNTKEPLIKSIVIQPPTDDYHKPPKQVQPVTFLRLQQGAKTGKTYYMPAQFIAPVPYQPMMNAPSPMPSNYSLVDYLAEVAKRNPGVDYRYGWERERPISLALWTIGSVVLVGGIWPTLLGLMTGAGVGGAREKKAKKEDYFDRFSHSPEPELSARPSLAVSAAERDRLDQMNEALERDLAAAGIDQTPAQNAPVAVGEGVRKLEGGPLETSQSIKTPGDDDEIEVKGEYYPVLIHHKKHHEEDGDAGKSH